MPESYLAARLGDTIGAHESGWGWKALTAIGMGVLALGVAAAIVFGGGELALAAAGSLTFAWQLVLCVAFASGTTAVVAQWLKEASNRAIGVTLGALATGGLSSAATTAAVEWSLEHTEEASTHLHPHLDGEPCGTIVDDCSPDTYIENERAARAHVDRGSHAGGGSAGATGIGVALATGLMFPPLAGAGAAAAAGLGIDAASEAPNPSGAPILQGSATVLVNRRPLARESDAVKCGGIIIHGCDRTWIGGPPDEKVASSEDEVLDRISDTAGKIGLVAALAIPLLPIVEAAGAVAYVVYAAGTLAIAKEASIILPLVFGEIGKAYGPSAMYAAELGFNALMAVIGGMGSAHEPTELGLETPPAAEGTTPTPQERAAAAREVLAHGGTGETEDVPNLELMAERDPRRVGPSTKLPKGLATRTINAHGNESGIYDDAAGAQGTTPISAAELDARLGPAQPNEVIFVTSCEAATAPALQELANMRNAVVIVPRKLATFRVMGSPDDYEILYPGRTEPVQPLDVEYKSLRVSSRTAAKVTDHLLAPGDDVSLEGLDERDLPEYLEYLRRRTGDEYAIYRDQDGARYAVRGDAESAPPRRAGDERVFETGRAERARERHAKIDPSKPKLKAPPVPPGYEGNADFNARLMKWGTGDAQAIARAKTVTREEMVEGGMTKELAQQWADYYAAEAERNTASPSARGRAILMRRVVELLGEPGCATCTPEADR